MIDSTGQIAGHYPGVAEDPEALREAGLVFVGSYASRAALEEHGLVLLSMGFPYWVFTADTVNGLYSLYVHAAAGSMVRDELQRYDTESAAWQQTLRSDPIPNREYRAGIHFAFLYVIALLAGYRIQRGDPALEERLINDNLALFHSGEWWRPLTALFLHADTGHLLNNLGMGLLFGLLCSKSMGALLAWTLILAGGVLGNLATAWTYLPEAHRALGASTAVFAAVGVLSGHGGAETLREHSRATLFRKALPLLGGLVLLGWYGFGPDPRTDVVAHVWGFAAGAVLGLGAGTLQIRRSLRASSTRD